MIESGRTGLSEPISRVRHAQCRPVCCLWANMSAALNDWFNIKSDIANYRTVTLIENPKLKIVLIKNCALSYRVLSSKRNEVYRTIV